MIPLRTLVIGLAIGCLCCSARTAPAQISIASYNIRYANPNDGEDIWEHRKEAVAEYLQRLDLVGLQEVTEPQLAYLRGKLAGFDSYGVGRDDGKSGGEHAPIFFRRDCFESIDQGTFWLSETPDVVGKKGWDAALPRTCTWMRLRHLASGNELYVANTHFDHRGLKARAESGKLLAERLGALPEKLPIVLLGDFNCLKESDPYNAITTTLADARTQSKTAPNGPSSTWNGFREIIPDRIIDHIFVRGLVIGSIAVDDPKTSTGRFASDHLPVRCTISLEK